MELNRRELGLLGDCLEDSLFHSKYVCRATSNEHRQLVEKVLNFLNDIQESMIEDDFVDVIATYHNPRI